MAFVIFFIISENKQLHQIITMINRRIWEKKKEKSLPSIFDDIRLWPVTELPGNGKSLSISFACSSSSVCVWNSCVVPGWDNRTYLNFSKDYKKLKESKLKSRMTNRNFQKKKKKDGDKIVGGEGRKK